VSLARIAKPGEVLVDSDVRGVRHGELGIVGSRVSTDAGKRVRGWRLDVKKPWRMSSSAKLPALHVPETAPASIQPTGLEHALVSAHDDVLATTSVNPVPSFTPEQLAAAEKIGQAEVRAAAARAAHHAGGSAALEERIRKMTHVRRAPDALRALRRTRADAEGADAQCHASLALAVALGLAGRAEEALLEGMDALARARESGDEKATKACLALLSKLYLGAGRASDAEALRGAV
jgi:hypothetical protein